MRYPEMSDALFNVADKSFTFAVHLMELSKEIKDIHKERLAYRQLMRAFAPRRAMEIRFQGHQIDRAHQARRDRSADHLESDEPAGIWLLFERQSGRRPSPLEPEDRASHRPAVLRATPQYPHVQWIC